MHRLRLSALILPFLLMWACVPIGPPMPPTTPTEMTPTAMASDTPAPTATATPEPLPTLAPGQDACDREPLRAYLQRFAVSMMQYELSLAQVFGLTMNKVATESLNAAIDQAQAARDSIANMPTPYCAQKMQTALLSSMDHMIAGLRLSVDGSDPKKMRTEFSQASLDYNTVNTEFGTLSAKAGLGAGATPTP